MDALLVSDNMVDCGICCEAYNYKNHTKVQCQFCDFNSCRDCVQHYLLTTTNDAHCMSCKNAWSREFVDQSCTKVFRNKQLKDHRETILVERERCLLPQTQPLVERRKQELNIEKLLVQSRVEQRRQRELQIKLDTQIYQLRSFLEDTPENAEREENAIRRHRQCRVEQRRQRDLQIELENQLARLRAGHDVIPETPKQKFVRKCPIGECRGFLSDKWKCGTCESKVCSKCNEIDEGEGHQCDPNNVETVKMLKKDTKPCPACGTMIFKISGCNQMWCPDCHTAFDWVSGRIETGMIHNPHFYEFQRRGGGGQANRNLGDIPCGGMPTVSELILWFRPNRPLDPNRIFPGYTRDFDNESPEETKIFDIHRSIVHVQNVDMLRYRVRNPDNVDLRINYLMGDISEDFWKKELQKREKAREKARDISQILEMYSNTGADYIRQMMLNENTVMDTIKFFTELTRYFNETMEVIHSRYNCVTPYIVPENFTVVSYSYKGKPRA